MGLRPYFILILLSLFVVAPSALAAQPRAADPKADRSEQEFCRLDTNKDREISYEEFAQCEFYRLEHARKLPFVDLSKFPRDKNGNVAEEDLKRYLFDRADKNKNGRIDRKEWEEFYNSVTAPY
jgi:hypothetical protein